MRFMLIRSLPGTLSILALLSLLAAAHAYAAEEPARKAKSGSAAERAVEKSGKALGNTADKVEKSVKKGAAATEKAINNAGQKTGQWLNEKTK